MIRLTLRGIVKGAAALLKGGGEGSRGGKIIGHTRSGKPIYADSHTRGEAWHSQEHQDARSAHIDAGHHAFTASLTESDPARRQGLRAEASAHDDAMKHHGAAANAAREGEQARGYLSVSQGGKLVPGNLEPAHAYRSHDMASWSRADHLHAAAMHAQRAAVAEPGTKIQVDHGPDQKPRMRETDARQHHETASTYHHGHAHRLALGSDDPVIVQHAQARPGFRIPPPSEIVKSVRLVLKAKAPAPLKPEASPGAHVLGKTRSGKPVFASGAEASQFAAPDHQDAARLHQTAGDFHEAQAEEHGDTAGKDPDWRRAESHATDADRHRKLATHHGDLVRDHLLAGGHGATVPLTIHGKGKVEAGKPQPHAREDRQEAKARFQKRTHRDYPGGATDHDRASYRRGAA